MLTVDEDGVIRKLLVSDMRLHMVAMTLFRSLKYYYWGISINQAVKGEKWYGVHSDSLAWECGGGFLVVVFFGFVWVYSTLDLR